jgi:hypothetical protein
VPPRRYLVSRIVVDSAGNCTSVAVITTTVSPAQAVAHNEKASLPMAQLALQEHAGGAFGIQTAGWREGFCKIMDQEARSSVPVDPLSCPNDINVCFVLNY